MKTWVNEYQQRALWGSIWKPSYNLSPAHRQIRQLTKPAVHMKALPIPLQYEESNGISNQKRSLNLTTGRHLTHVSGPTLLKQTGTWRLEHLSAMLLSLVSRGQQTPRFCVLSIEHTVFKSHFILGTWNTIYLSFFVSQPRFYLSEKSRNANRLKKRATENINSSS